MKKYVIGDHVTDGKFNMKVVDFFLNEDDGIWWYECEPLDFNAFTREFPQYKLSLINSSGVRKAVINCKEV